MDDDEKYKLVSQLRERMSDVEPLPHDDFFSRTDTYVYAVTTCGIILVGNFSLCYLGLVYGHLCITNSR